MLNLIMKRTTMVVIPLFILDSVISLILAASGALPTGGKGALFFEYLGYITPVINSVFLVCIGWIVTKSIGMKNGFSEESGGQVKRFALSIVIALIFIPIVFAPSMLFPYIVGKAFAFRFLVLALFFVYLYLAFKDKSFWPRITMPVLAFGILTFTMGLSTFFSIDIYKSFWGNYERMEGYVTTIYLFLLLLTLTSLRLRDLEWRKIFIIHFGVSLFVSGMGLIQFIVSNMTVSNLAANLPIIGSCVNKVSCKVDSTLGNSIYLGIYAALSMWIILYVIFRFRPERYLGLLWFGFFINLAALWLSGARGSLLGFIFGAIAATCIYLFINKMYKKLGVVIAGFILFTVIFSGIVWYTKKIGIAQNIPIVSKFASTNTLLARLSVWQTGIAAFKEKPILGSGQENFIHSFNRLYNPAMYGQETYFDHPHNTYIGWLAMGGALGFLAYLFFILSVLWSTFKSYLKEENKSDIGLSIALGAIATYLFHIFFVFDSLTSIMIFIFISIYFTRNISLGSIKIANLDASKLKNLSYILIVIFIVFSFFFWWRPAYANFIAIKALSSSATNPLDIVKSTNAQFKKAISLDTFGTYEIRDLYLQKAMEYANLIGQVQDKEVQTAIVNFNSDAIAEFTLQTNNSYDHKSKFMLGIYYSNLQSLDNAEKILTEALALAPNKQVAMLALARVYLLKNDAVKSLEMYKRAVDVTPTNSTQYNPLRIQYIQALMLLGKDAEALSVVKDLLPASNRQEFQSLVSGMIQVYSQRKDLKGLIAMLSDARNLDPQNENFVLWLAQALVVTGNYDAAVNQIEKLDLINPQFVARFKTDLQNLIKQNKETNKAQEEKEVSEKEVSTSTKKATTSKR